MPKILHISKYYFPFRGGTEAVAQDVAEGLKDFDNKVIAFNHEKGSKTDSVNGIEVTRVGCFAKIASQSLSFYYFGALKRVFKRWEPDAVHFHHPNLFVASFMSLLLPKKTKLVIHWHLDIVKQKYLYMLFKHVERKMLRRADVVVVTSHKYAEHSKALAPYMDKVQVIYNGIRTARLDCKEGDDERIEEIRLKYGHRPIVFFIGRHVAYKGLEYLLEAEKLVMLDCVFVIGGEGALTEGLKSQTSSHRVVFVGKLSEVELRCYLHAAAIFAFPSITKNEAFGLALAEAMYCKCVPVTFTIEGSGVNEVSLNGITGIEVDNRNVHQYAEAIDTLLKGGNLRLAYGESARQRVMNLFTVEHEQAAFGKLYHSLLD